MNNASIVIQKPADDATSLVLLFHGVGALPENMAFLGSQIAARHPEALVVAVRSPDPSDFGHGRQWFSVKEITEANRPARIAAAMPTFLREISAWQQEANLGAAKTILLGFSQGAIMALESTLCRPAPAAHVISLAGRFAALPNRCPAAKIHLVHGAADTVIPHQYSQKAAARIRELGCEASLDIVPGLGHGIDEHLLKLVLKLFAGF